MRKFLFHASLVVVVLVCLFTVWLIRASAQTPTGPVVIMYTPQNAAVQMFADGTTNLPLLPAGTAVRLPPQDSNDVGVKFNLFAREICSLGNTVSLVKSVVDKHKIVCP